MPTAVTDATFEQEVIKSSLPVLVDFWAPWCGPCKVMGPVVDELSAEYEGKVKFAKVNVDENGAVSGSLNIMSIPTFVLFKEGKPVKGFMGAMPKDTVKQFLEEHTAA
ncbi:MAG: thioredoxin [Candidatus Peribacteraceae bacterium]|jgi:thioredoxin 1